MLNLSNVTLLIVDCIDPKRAELALTISTSYVKFGDVKLLTNLHFESKYKVVEIEKISSIYEYNRFMIEDLNDYVDTEYVLIVHHDGFLINPKAWTEEFLEYDYIGAVWFPGPYHKTVCVGNGGFCLRSKRLLEAVQDIGYHNAEHEDVYICEHIKPMLEEDGIVIAPIELAQQFSKEHGQWNGQLGFHNFKTDLSLWKDYKLYFK